MARIARPAAREAAAPAVKRLVSGQEAEALAFLGARPIHTVIMSGMIRDNGLGSPRNRGSFYGVRDSGGELSGVALLGHLTFVEARDERVLAAFARRARRVKGTHLIMGESDKIDQFWSHYATGGRIPHRLGRQQLLELRRPPRESEPVPSLRRATPADLEHVAKVHAGMVYRASGVNPLTADREGFITRTLRRIEHGRVWVWIEGGRLIFKADIVADTPEVVYLEGIYVHPRERGKGYGLRCLSRLGGDLLARTESVCLLVEEGNAAALSLYRRAGYELRSHYDTIFLRRPPAS